MYVYFKIGLHVSSVTEIYVYLIISLGVYLIKSYFSVVKCVDDGAITNEEHCIDTIGPAPDR